MITLKEALKLSKEEISELRKDLVKRIKEKKEIGAYIEQLVDKEIASRGDGIPILIKDNIQVKG